jgi:hypothetical protein
MTLPKMRPTFELSSSAPPEQTIRSLRSLADDASHPIDTQTAGTHLMLSIPSGSRHFWSPYLHLEIHSAQSGATVQGRFSPNPSVWTGIMLTYIALCTLMFFAAVIAFAQLMMQRSPSALIPLPFLVLICAAIYWASLVGQRLANEQMHQLHDAVASRLSERSPTRPPPSRPDAPG